jgi:hypothetical protein
VREQRWSGEGVRRIALTLVAVVVTGVAHAGYDTSSRASRGALFVPTGDQAKLWALGFDPIVADYFWLRALELVGAETGATEQHGEEIAAMIDLITEVDPWVDHPYRFAALWLTGSADLVRHANRLLQRGVSYHPLEWRDRYHLGFNRFFYLEDELGAADVLESAIGLTGAPTYLAALAARLRAQQGGLEVAAGFLKSTLDSTSDGFARAAYLKALDEIETERAARFLDAAREEYWRRQGRDIAAVDELLAGPNPVLQALPPAHLHHAGFEWVLDADRTIVSSFYRTRYELHVTEADRARQARWRQASGSDS